MTVFLNAHARARPQNDCALHVCDNIAPLQGQQKCGVLCREYTKSIESESCTLIACRCCRGAQGSSTIDLLWEPSTMYRRRASQSPSDWPLQESMGEMREQRQIGNTCPKLGCRQKNHWTDNYYIASRYFPELIMSDVM